MVCSFMIFTNYAQDGTDSFKTLQSVYQTTIYDKRPASPPGCFISDQKLPRIHRNTALGGSYIRSRRFVQKKTSCLASDFTPNPQMSSPYPSLCTDYTTLLRNKSLRSFLGPYTKRGVMLHHEVLYMTTFYETFVSTLGFQIKLLI